MSQLWDLFIAFFRTGLFGFGGGMATLPLIQEEIVERYQWLTMEEFTDAVALGNSLPGPIATKMAALVGYRIQGFLGMAVSLAGMVLPSTVLIIALVTLYLRYKNTAWLEGMMRGVRPVVVALIFQVTLMMGRTSLFSGGTVLLAIVAFVMVYVFNVHPVITILIGMAFGGVLLRG